MDASPFRKSVTGRVGIVAHRGLSAEAPENTMAAFRRAVEVGCDLLELDCHLSKDGVVVIIHDDTLDRTTDSAGPVRDLTWHELQRLDAGSWFAPEFAGQWIPRLDELATWAREQDVVLSIEIKQPRPATGAPRYAGIEERIAEIVSAFELEGRVLVHSFDHRSVKRFGELMLEVATGVSYGGEPVDPVMMARMAGAVGLHQYWEVASPELCTLAHEAGMHVHAWGAPEPSDPAIVAMLVRAGVDTLDANDPRRLRAILDALTDP